MQCPRSVEGSRQQGEIRLCEFLSPPEQAHDDKEISIGKKRTPEFGHHDRIRHGGDDSYGKDADRKIGGPESAGINRQEAENERFSRGRSSDPLGPEFCAERREARSEA